MRAPIASCVVGLVVLLLVGTGANAGLSRADLSSVSAAPPAGARLEPALTAPDETGKIRSVGEILSGLPGFVAFVDYHCTTLCGPDLMLLSVAIERARLPSSAYRIVTIGLNPKPSPEAARAMKEAELPAELRDAAVFLLPDKDVLRSATEALGFHYVYDATADQFAHPAIVYVIGPDGKLRSAFSPFDLLGVDLRAVLDPPQQLNLAQRIRLLCYAYDPATGTYTLRILTLLRVVGLATVILVAAAVLALNRLRRRTA